MSRHRSSPETAPPLEDEDLLQEILLLLPPQPSSLPRASAVCRRWRGILSDAQFLKRFRKHHRKPPLLGFIGYAPPETSDSILVFTPVLDSPNRIPSARFSIPTYDEDWEFMGCRHGLAVLLNVSSQSSQGKIVVWDPLIGQLHRVTCPPGDWYGYITVSWQATVLCADAEDGRVHGNCFSSPFKLVLIWVVKDTQAFACVYESASGKWGDIVSMRPANEIYGIRPGVLVGNALCWLLYGGDILVFGLQSQSLDVIKKPIGGHITDNSWDGSLQLLRTENNGLGLAYLSELTIHVWERKSNGDGVVRWVLLQKIIQLEGLIPQMSSDLKKVLMTGYDEDTNVILLCTTIGDFTLQVDMAEFKHIVKRNRISYSTHYPYSNFYTGGSGVGCKVIVLEL